ncbi:YsnF/AvaK domain-containing protein [Heliobacterium gestii]|uniref:YsnF/AvaK domain-containing protein n=1 Tax=Heliomicrobium gestii TaxID=2699 RepID=A0A845LI16_HELGE|nr:YsnF/AvaK domain-containing protein [Heliomicrobium gestii]MBM7868524.1 uncharacterized protein (TIGR02271 family) [Heliomicrobium gestii]MZP44680.1 YsnF/AvaK domain-containing protein [Heliomicrobium gestii]
MMKFEHRRKGVANVTNSIVIGITCGAVAGGLLGALLHAITAGIGLGAVGGGIMGSVVGLYQTQRMNPANLARESEKAVGVPKVNALKDMKENAAKANIRLRQEQLDISKKRIQTGEVTVHKEVITEHKQIVVPVKREELIIEKSTPLTSTNAQSGHDSALRIPLREERLEIIKLPVTVNEVSLSTNQVENTKAVEAVLRNEKLTVRKIGGATVLKKRNLP